MSIADAFWGFRDVGLNLDHAHVFVYTLDRFVRGKLTLPFGFSNSPGCVGMISNEAKGLHCNTKRHTAEVALVEGIRGR